MAIIRTARPESGFYQLDKKISEDLRLSWAARGLLIFLLGKPDGWQVNVKALVNETEHCVRGAAGHTKRDGVKAILGELGMAGYLTRSEKPRHLPDGTLDGYDYFVSELPSTPQPARDRASRALLASNSPAPDQPSPVQPATLQPHQVNTDIAVKTEGEKSLPSTAAPSKQTAEKSDAVNHAYPADFETFWRAYPRRQGKLAALRKWEAGIKIIGGKRSAAIASILAGAERYAKAMLGKDPQFIVMPEGWLNQGRWDDEEIPEAAAGAPLDWWTSFPGVESKGKALEVARKVDESPFEFRLRVLIKAGAGPWQDAELARATRDNASAYVARLRKLFGYADPVALPVAAAPAHPSHEVPSPDVVAARRAALQGALKKPGCHQS